MAISETLEIFTNFILNYKSILNVCSLISNCIYTLCNLTSGVNNFKQTTHFDIFGFSLMHSKRKTLTKKNFLFFLKKLIIFRKLFLGLFDLEIMNSFKIVTKQHKFNQNY